MTTVSETMPGVGSYQVALEGDQIVLTLRAKHVTVTFSLPVDTEDLRGDIMYQARHGVGEVEALLVRLARDAAPVAVGLVRGTK